MTNSYKLIYKTKVKITLTINGKKIIAKKGDKLLDVCEAQGIEIPKLCSHPDLKIHANCRLCSVEIKGAPRLIPSCSTQVQDGMEIQTHSVRVKKARKMILEYVYGEHVLNCNECLYSEKCDLRRWAKEYGIDQALFQPRKAHRPLFTLGNTITFDTRKCIECRNCIDVCKQQGIGCITLDNKGVHSNLKPKDNPQNDCVYCGQCINHCPVGAIHSRKEYDIVMDLIDNPDLFVVAQVAPSIRVAIGEEFGLPHGEIMTGQMVSALNQLGFDKVFDVQTGADFTTIEEAQEFVNRIQNGGVLPMFTTCCPAWYKYVEQKHPELIPNCTTARSPNMMSGAIIKEYYAQTIGIPKEKIVVVAIMPCTAKKFETKREELYIDNLPPVDYSITTREFAHMLKLKKIDLKQMPKTKFDSPVGESSGAGAIYGASGGVMESALRTAYNLITGEDLKDVNFKAVRGSLKGIKRATVKVADKELKIAIINGLGNVEEVLADLKKDPNAYHYIEVMTCPGGCIAGGGQPLPVNNEIRKKRAQALYKIDAETEIRLAHHNPDVKKVYKDFFDKNEGMAHKILHTHYTLRDKVEVEEYVCPIAKNYCEKKK